MGGRALARPEACSPERRHAAEDAQGGRQTRLRRPCRAGGAACSQHPTPSRRQGSQGSYLCQRKGIPRRTGSRRRTRRTSLSRGSCCRGGPAGSRKSPQTGLLEQKNAFCKISMQLHFLHQSCNEGKWVNAARPVTPSGTRAQLAGPAQARSGRSPAGRARLGQRGWGRGRRSAAFILVTPSPLQSSARSGRRSTAALSCAPRSPAALANAIRKRAKMDYSNLSV